MELAKIPVTPISTNMVTKDIAFQIGDVSVVIDILRSRLYSKPIQTLVQEYLSNSFDAQREAGSTAKIEIGTPTYADLRFWVRDYGVGLSPERVETVFTFYGNSTKRTDNKQLGGFGIGSKSAWSYTDSYTITSWHGGMKRVYVAHLGSGNEGTLSLVAESASEDPTGVMIEIPVKPDDIFAFRHAAVRATFLWSDMVCFKDDYSSRCIPEEVYSKNGLRIFTGGANIIDHGFYASAGGIPYYVGDKLESADVTFKDGGNIIVMDCDITSLKISASRESISNVKYAQKKLTSAIMALRKEKFAKLESAGPDKFWTELSNFMHGKMSFLFNKIPVMEGAATAILGSDHVRFIFPDLVFVPRMKCKKTSPRFSVDREIDVYFRNGTPEIPNFYTLAEVATAQQGNYQCECSLSEPDRLLISRLSALFMKTPMLIIGRVHLTTNQNKNPLPTLDTVNEKYFKAIETLGKYFPVKPLSEFDFAPYKTVRKKQEPFEYRVFDLISSSRSYYNEYVRGNSCTIEFILERHEGKKIVYGSQEDISGLGYWQKICNSFKLPYMFVVVLAARTVNKLKTLDSFEPFGNFMCRVAAADAEFADVRDWCYVQQNETALSNLTSLPLDALSKIDAVFKAIELLSKVDTKRNRLSFKRNRLLFDPDVHPVAEVVKTIKDRYPLLRFIEEGAPANAIHDYVKTIKEATP